jgi:general secretion pathway protein A
MTLYLKFWGLESQPFENVPDPRFFFSSVHHAEALARMKYAFSARRGAAMLTGEVGCGKTTICRVLANDLKKENHKVALIENPSMDATELIQEILSRFGVTRLPDQKRELLNVMHSQLLEGVRKRQETVVIIDEAQVITPISVFEELRLLLNFNLEDRYIMTLILVGQPELRDIVADLKQLNQRIAVKYHIDALDFKETVKYIVYRLERVGATGSVFTEEALRLVYQFSEGIPRNINNCCDMALLVAANKKLSHIDESIVKELIQELEKA